MSNDFNISIEEPSGQDYGDSPLQEFTGKGNGFMVKGGQSKAGNPWQRVYFRFSDVEVIETSEIYPFPTAELSIFYSDPKKTAKRRPGQGTSEWEVISESIRNVMGSDPTALNTLFGGRVYEEGQQPAQEGKTMHLKRVSSLIRVGPNESEKPEWFLGDESEWVKTRSQWHDEWVPAWQIVEVQGVQSNGTGSNKASAGAAQEVHQRLLELADGKTVEDFYSQALAMPEVLSDANLVGLLTDRKFVATMIQFGGLVQDSSGVLHKA